MRIQHYIIITAAVLVAIFMVGCSKSPSKLADMPAPTPTNFGVVELSENTPKHLSLGTNRDCVVTAQPIGGGTIKIAVTTQVTNADGTVKQIYLPKTVYVPGQAVSFTVDDVPVRLTPKITTP